MVHIKPSWRSSQPTSVSYPVLKRHADDESGCACLKAKCHSLIWLYVIVPGMYAHVPLEPHAAPSEGGAESTANMCELENATPAATVTHFQPSPSLPAQYSSNGAPHSAGCEKSRLTLLSMCVVVAAPL